MVPIVSGRWIPVQLAEGGPLGDGEAVLTHGCGGSCGFRAVSGGGANSQMPGFENLHRFSQKLNLRKSPSRFFDADEICFTPGDSPGILVRLIPQS